MNHYKISIVKKGQYHIFFDLYVNNILANTDGYICLSKEDFDRFFKDLFKSSRGNCQKMYSTNPPTEFYS